MKDVLNRLLDQLRSANGTTRIAIAGAVVLMLVVGGYTALEARTPHFVLLYSQLDEAASARVQSALAGADVRFKASQPPAPYFVHVDSAEEYRARNAVALAGALTPEDYGIQASSRGMNDVFQDADTRRQRAKKLEWQEMEKQLEVFEFVLDAAVTTSSSRPSAFQREAPVTVSVTLTLRNGTRLSVSQTETVAKLVRNRFGVPDENVMISDHQGRVLFDGSSANDGEPGVDDLLAHKLRFEGESAERINRILERILGEGRGEVIVSSEWSFDQSEKVTERLDPENKAVISEQKDSSKTPQPVAIGGPAGTDSNLTNGFGTENAALPQPTGSGVATTEEVSRQTRVGSSTEYVQSRAPVLRRLSVALFADESAPGDLASLEASIKEAVGFDETRGDTFRSFRAPFASIERDADGRPVTPPPAEPVAEPDPLIEMLLQRGVEIVAALVFLVLLLKTLRGRRKSKKSVTPYPAPTAALAQSREPDPELLARAQIEELLNTDPERVGEVLSRWATEESHTVGMASERGS